MHVQLQNLTSGTVQSLDFLGRNGGISCMLLAVIDMFLWEVEVELEVVGVSTGVMLAERSFTSVCSSGSFSFSSDFLRGWAETRLWLGETENLPINLEENSSGDGVAFVIRLASLLAHSILAISVANQPGMSGIAHVIMKRITNIMCWKLIQFSFV